MSVKPQARFIIFQNLFDSIKIIALPHTRPFPMWNYFYYYLRATVLLLAKITPPLIPRNFLEILLSQSHIVVHEMIIWMVFVLAYWKIFHPLLHMLFPLPLYLSHSSHRCRRRRRCCWIFPSALANENENEIEKMKEEAKQKKCFRLKEYLIKFMHIENGVFMPTEYVMSSTSHNCHLVESHFRF